MRRSFSLLAPLTVLALAVVTWLAPRAVLAEDAAPLPAKPVLPQGRDVTAAARAEARERFDRGLAMFEQQRDPAAALAELKRAYDLVPSERTLFVMGLVYAAMKRPVEALEALDEVLRQPGDLTAAQKDLARRKRDEQKQRAGVLQVKSNVPASIDVDGIPRGHIDGPRELRVAAGLRVITLQSPGFLPARREVSVAGDATVPLAFTLEPAGPAPLRALEVRTNVPDVELFVDGAPVPSSSLRVDQRPHLIEARRACYATASHRLGSEPTLALASGAAVPSAAPQEIALRLLPANAPCPRGHLVLRASETSAEATLDGGPPFALDAAVDVPVGRHALVVKRAGFLTREQIVDVPASGEITFLASLVPTPETRVAYVERATSLRRWGRVLVIAGTGLAVLGGVASLVTGKAVNDARADRDRIFRSFDPGQPCVTFTAACEAALNQANENVRRQELWRGLSWGTAAAGLVAAVTGGLLWTLGPAPDRYDRAPP